MKSLVRNAINTIPTIQLVHIWHSAQWMCITAKSLDLDCFDNNARDHVDQE